MSQVARLVAVHCMTIALLLASAGAAETKATKDQVLGVYSGKTHYVRIQQREWALFFRPDGSARGRSGGVAARNSRTGIGASPTTVPSASAGKINVG